MKISLAKKNPAFAVIVALVAATVLSLLAGAFAYAMKIETRLAANANNDEQFYWLGRGGVDRACWWLALEGGQPYSSKEQYWNGGPGDGPETNTPLAGMSLDNYSIGPGTVSLKLIELESKININLADTPIIQQILTTMGADAGDISVVADSVQDWVDPNDATRPAGAESDFYQGMNPPYYAHDAPVSHIEELRLIKGITPEMFSGGSPPGSAPGPQHHLGFGHAPGQTPSYPFGLRDVFTPFSSGKINLLTADDTVLSVLPGMDTSVLQMIQTSRSSEPPARSLGQLLAGVPPQVAAQIQRYVDIRGDTYEVHATATIGELSHEYTAILFRNRGGNNVQVVSFYRTK